MADQEFNNFINMMIGIFTATVVLTVVIYGLWYGLAQYEAGALNTWF